ncbi:DDE-type integrase/transposase/recombinase [Pseudomonas aeruginosa]|uniref:DDE-type integrase/transposase/recombinase n=1 Tax=Pseudomonas aeruginosa TaxID=287 RepID=UPI001BC9C431|nr:DDE-type integrase/transposase/recombinase [Pseudomonas aeruginosa]
MMEIEPHTGMRFTLHEIDYEVIYVAEEKVRYASQRGGKQHHIELSKFLELFSSQKAKLIGNNVVKLSQENLKAAKRKYEYIKAAITQTKSPMSSNRLKIVITEASNRIADPTPPSTSTVAKWVRAYLDNGQSSLSPKKKPGNRTLRFSPEIETLIHEAIESEYLCKEKRNCLDVLAYIVGKLYERGIANATGSELIIPNLRTIQRRVKKLDPYLVTKARLGKHIADRISRAAGSKIQSYAPLTDVEIDTHILDILVLDPETGDVLGRPYLTCIIDRNTRVVVGTYICMYPPSATTALAALIDMISRPSRGLPGGIPSKITPDNGVEFKNTSFMHTCAQLSITITPAPVREPNAKSYVESFFRSLTYGIIQKVSGTTFSNPVKKGDYRSEKHALLNLEQIRSITESWINDVYHNAIHSRTGRAPILHWRDETKNFPPLYLSDSEAQAIARRPLTRSIQKGQVQVDHLFYYSHSLTLLQAEGITRVTVLVNELDLSEVLVKNPLNEIQMITALSTDPNYTKDLTCYAHEECQKIKKSMKQSDLNRLGPLSNLLARWELMKRIHSESIAAKRWIKKITNGEKRKNVDVTKTEYPTHQCEQWEDLALEVDTEISSQDERITSYKSVRV